MEAQQTVSGHMSFAGEEYYLVRRKHVADSWHPVDDNLAGTQEYGTLTTNSMGASTFSVLFGNSFTKYLLASGDMSMWLIIAKNELANQCAASCENCLMVLLDSSNQGRQVAQYCRVGTAEDPWLSAQDHPDSIVYGEGQSNSHHLVDDALHFGGANVWINAPPISLGT